MQLIFFYYSIDLFNIPIFKLLNTFFLFVHNTFLNIHVPKSIDVCHEKSYFTVLKRSDSPLKKIKINW